MSKVQILSDKKMDAHVQKQTYYQLRGTSWIIGIGWQQHSRATNYLSQQANSRLSKTENSKKKSSRNFRQSQVEIKIAKRRKHSKTNSNPYQLHVSKMLFLSSFECLAVKISISYSLFRPGFDHELNT